MDFTCYSSNHIHIDKDCWVSWLQGYPIFNAAKSIGISVSQYRNFEILEQFLIHPKTLSTQLIFDLHPKLRQELISSFYRIDERICRELLGKKLSHRVRKDLDEISVKTSRSLAFCKRIFDNLKRITKRVEDSEDDMVAVIMNHFLLSHELATQYSTIIFLNHYRFDTLKRKLQIFGFEDFQYVASIFLQYFMSSTAALDDFDLLIAEDSRNLKSLIFNHKVLPSNIRTLLNGLD